MLVIGGEKDHQVPWAIAHATFKEQERQPRDHRDQGDPGPRAFAHHRQWLAGGRQVCLDFVRRFV